MLAFLRTLLAVIVGIFLSFFLIFVFFIILASTLKPQPESVKNNSILELKLDTEIPERPIDNPFADIPFFTKVADFPASLKEIVDNIEYAKTDKNIKGIYLETSMLTASLPTIEAIRNALIDFKTSGKFVYAYSEIYTNKSYYLSSVADSVFCNPTGAIIFNGFSSQQFYIKGMLEKLNIDVSLIRGSDNKYKSAGEMFIRKDMSESNRKQLTEYLGSVYQDFINKIATARKINADSLNIIADNLLARYPSDALKYHLVDKLAYKDEIIVSMKKQTDIKLKDNLNTISINKYVRQKNKNNESEKGNIALIYAVGDIQGGQGSETVIGSEKLSQTIRKARLDDNIKAIVLRVNSPGGGAMASDIIWREVVLAQKVKPVIASFGDLAASGGYYISAPAEYIFCEPNTITGSIGVFGLIPNFKSFWNNKLGITFDEVKVGKFSDLGNVNRPMTAEEVNIIQGYIDTTYNDFKKRVSEGRKLSPTFVDSIAQGHIYSGIQAKKLGLIDEIGSMDDAIAYAAKKANLTKYTVRILPRYDDLNPTALMRSLGMGKEQVLKDELKESYTLFKKLQGLQKLQGILMYYPYDTVIY